MNPIAPSPARFRPARSARPAILAVRVAVAAAACSLLLAAAPALRAANWPNWRGPSFNGASEEKKLPTRWTRTEGIAWTTAMPGPSGATPAIWNDTIFVASTDDTAKTCVALALDRKTGKELWRVKIADGVGKDRMSTYSNPSPVTDGRHVWFFFGTGDLVCLDFKGQEVWKKNIQKEYGQFAFLWTFSTSPVLHDGRLILQVLQRDTPVDGRGRKDGPNESYIVALAPETGKELWKVTRPADAREESLEAFTTPTPYRHAGRDELLIAGGDCLTGHDPKTGKELWRWGTWNPSRIGHWRLVPSPAAGDGVVLGCGPKDAPIYAVKLGGNGTLPNSQLAWQSFVQTAEDASKAGPSLEHRDLSSDVPTPLFYQGRFYVLNGRKKLLISIDPKTGKTFWSGSLPGKAIFETSPTAGAGKIYAINHAGEVFVVQAGGSEFKLLHTVAMADPDEKSIRPCVVPSNGQLFIRTAKNLFCVSGQE